MTPTLHRPLLSRAHALSHLLLSVTALGSTVLLTRAAAADVTCGDTTCPTGFICQSYDIGCPMSKSGTVDPSCQNTKSYSCVPAPCTQDSECGVGMVCHASTSTACSGGAARSDCPPDAPDCTTDVVYTPTECISTTTSTCIPRYELPCNVDSDCGDGFTCEANTYGMCTGSAGTGSATAPSAQSDSSGATTDIAIATGGAGSVPTPVDGGAGGAATATSTPRTTSEPVCTTVVSDTKSCHLKQVACESDAQCPSGFTCETMGQTGTCSASSDGTTSCTTTTPATKACMPPYARLTGVSSGNAGIAIDQSGTGSTSGNETATSTKNGDTTPTGSGPAPTAPNTGSSSDGAAASPTDGSADGGGCSIGNSARNQQGWLSLVLLSLGIAMWRARRHH